ncbi:MAG: tetratricopeptide repeat protein, partial [Parachlamydiaceae bacterium]
EANNRNSFNDLTAYLEFLNDLNECEKTYSEALRLSSFFPSDNNEFYVIHLEEEEKILGHIKTSNLDPTASSADWLLLIRYHYLRGTIDELAYSEKPKPEKRLEKALIYYYAENYQYVHSILANSNDLNCFEVWLLFIACQKLYLKRDMDKAFSQIENSFPIPWRIILDDAFAALESSITPENRNRVLIYLHKQLESHPYCIKLLRLLSRISDAPLSHQYQRKALKLQLAYPNVTNQIYNIIETGSSFIEKYHSLLQLLKINPLRSIFSELLKITENNPEKRAEALSIARSLKTSFFYETQFAQELNPIEEKGTKEALEKVATLLVVSPNHKKLRLKKISLLIKLNRTPESIFEIKEYLKRFGSTLDLLTLLDRHVDNPCIRGFHLEAHLEKFKLKPTPSNFNELIGLYRKYKSPIECIALSIEAAIISEIDIVSEDFYDALKELKNEKSALEILEKVPLEPCFSTIIANRALFYSNILEIDNALRDIENVIKLKNDDKSKEYKLYILLTHRRLDEAVSFYFSVSVDFPSDIVVKLSHDLLNQKKYDLVEKVLKKSKRKLSSKEKKCLASSFIHLGKHQEAIAIFKELIKDDPQDENNYFGRALCYDALGQFGNAIDSLSNAIDLSPDREDWIKWRAELQEKLSRPAEPALKPQAVTTQPKMRPSAPYPKKVPYIF